MRIHSPVFFGAKMAHSCMLHCRIDSIPAVPSVESLFVRMFGIFYIKSWNLSCLFFCGRSCLNLPGSATLARSEGSRAFLKRVHLPWSQCFGSGFFFPDPDQAFESRSGSGENPDPWKNDLPTGITILVRSLQNLTKQHHLDLKF